MITRAVLIGTLFTFVAVANIGIAQDAKNTRTIGVLRTGSLVHNDSTMIILRQVLAEVGYVDSRNIRIEQRQAEGRLDRLPVLAADLVRVGADVIIALNEASIRAAQQATRAIPIVMIAYDHDPIQAGFIQSLNQPGGNITGVFSRQIELAGKRIELLKETLPNVSRLAVLHPDSNRNPLEELAPAARALGLQLRAIGVRQDEDLAAAFKRVKSQGAGAVVVLYSPVFHEKRAQIAEAALEVGLPTMTQERDFVSAGAMMSYAPDREAVAARVAYYVDRILKGSKPSDLPVERADKFRLAVNLRTAKALGIKVPESILLRADEVIR